MRRVSQTDRAAAWGGPVGTVAISVILIVGVVGRAPARSQGAQANHTRQPPVAVIPADPPEITPAVRAAIERGTRFLVSTQNHDGSWRTDGSTGSYPVAMTSLAGLALLAGGNTPTQGPHARNVSMHGHGFAMLFLAQCYGMEEDPRRQAEIRLVLQRAIQLTARSQSAAGGWLYTPDAGGDEGSVTVTQVQALRACRNAGLAVPKQVIDGAMDYLERSANDDGGIRYQVSDTGPSRPAITAAAVACYFNAGQYDNPRARRALDFIRQHLSPEHGRSSRYYGHYYYAHLYMSQVMYLAGEDLWREYYSAMREVLIEKQDTDTGTWDGDHVGTTYGTAVALIILQLPYKNLPIAQR
jgi:hypothetical protein